MLLLELTLVPGNEHQIEIFLLCSGCTGVLVMNVHLAVLCNLSSAIYVHTLLHDCRYSNKQDARKTPTPAKRVALAVRWMVTALFMMQ